jgi:REP element-mobilizing transposase RayT
MSSRRVAFSQKRVSSARRPAAGEGSAQLALRFAKRWGGARDGAGRKPSPGRRNVPHRARPRHTAANPVHVTLRAAIRPLRSEHVFPTVCIAIRGATRRHERSFRVVHFSVQWDHVHLIVEASDERALSAGVRSVAIRIARYVNALLSRRGRFWADRWHGRALASPGEVRNALVYVLANFRKHANAPLGGGIDAFSSAAVFDGWRAAGELPRAGPPVHGAMGRWVVVSRTKTWLGAVGWRRRGLIGVEEAPVSA